MGKKEPEVEVTTAEKMEAFIDSLVGNATISADVAGIIKHAIEARRDELNS
jgi:hypothetical protein